MDMYKCVYVYMCTRVYVYMCICVYVYMCMCGYIVQVAGALALLVQMHRIYNGSRRCSVHGWVMCERMVGNV